MNKMNGENKEKLKTLWDGELPDADAAERLRERVMKEAKDAAGTDVSTDPVPISGGTRRMKLLAAACLIRAFGVGGFSALRQYAANLKMPLAKGARTAPGLRYLDRDYAVSENALGLRAIRFESGEPDAVTLTIDEKSSRVPVGYGEWLPGTLDIPSMHEPRSGRPAVPMDRQVSCCGAWTDENVYELRILYDRTPFYDILSFAFDEYGFRMRHRRITGFRLVDAECFGRPASGPALRRSAATEKEFRF